ncbi:NADAR family protein [Arcticibacter sp. MXS-1]|uniref:NADAR family protein n=1 Tax=Arcticibacter sp. MXS-1 TaxID=3341726 RepID=UPI0035A968B2
MQENSRNRIYKRKDSVVFSKTDGPFGGLSNMAPGFPLLINGHLLANSEVLYQAMRYPLFPDIQEEIISQNSPMTAKMISKKHLAKTRQDWNEIRVRVMRWCLEVKLSQNWEKFGELLRSTGDKHIVEYSTKDPFWGASESGEAQLAGTNALGRLLMDLRNKFVYINQKPERVPPPPITGFLLYGFEIETICEEPYFSPDHPVQPLVYA